MTTTEKLIKTITQHFVMTVTTFSIFIASKTVLALPPIEIHIDELKEKSDVVVLAEFVSTHETHADLEQIVVPKTMEQYYITIQSIFRVKSVLKNNETDSLSAGIQITVRHLGFKVDSQRTGNLPQLINFNSLLRRDDGKQSVALFLLYLNQTGQTYALAGDSRRMGQAVRVVLPVALEVKSLLQAPLPEWDELFSDE